MTNEKRANERMIILLETREKELLESVTFWQKVHKEDPSNLLYETQYNEKLRCWAEIQRVLISMYKICEEEKTTNTSEEIWG